MNIRLKRMRQNATVRAMVRETAINIHQVILPLFIHEGLKESKEIPAMPGIYQLSLNTLAKEIETISALGIRAVILFGIPNEKDAEGKVALREDGIIQKAMAIIRQTNKDLLIIADLCFCEYTTHGHCGVMHHGQIDNDKTLTLLARQAVSLADAGADWVAPSSMTDGMVGAIRHALDKARHENTAILSYAVKYHSCFYGPFREAAMGAPQFGDRQTYQMDVANANEAIREAQLDIEEGADLIMVKPAMNYLDIIYRIKQHFPEIPLCAYQVSGEYSMIKMAARAGVIDEEKAILESTLAIKRAGASLIISYFAKDLATLLARYEN